MLVIIIMEDSDYMKKVKGFIKSHKQLSIIGFSMLIFVCVLVAFIIFVKNENRRRKEFVKKVQDLYAEIVKQYDQALSEGEKLYYFSNSINGIRFQKDNLKYCAIFNEEGKITSIEATDDRYFIKTEKPDESSKINLGSYEKFKCSTVLPTLAVSGYDAKAKVRVNIFGGNIEEYRIEKIEFMPTNKVPENVLGSFDASVTKDKSIMAWYVDENKNNMYELYIGGKDGVVANEDSSYMFAGIYNLTELNLKYLDTSNVKDMHGMFYYLSNLKKLDVSNLDTSKVTNMSEMFYYLLGVDYLDLRTFNTENVKNMSRMFKGCWSLETLNLSSFNTENVENMSGMFESCSKLLEIDLKNFDTSDVKDATNMFSGCYMLNDEKIKNFNIPKIDKVDNMFCSTQVNSESEILSSINEKNRAKVLKCD